MTDVTSMIEKHLNDIAESAMTGTLTTATKWEEGPPLTLEGMLQGCLGALAPDDHWRVRPDTLMPLGVPVVRMTNYHGLRELHIGTSAASLMLAKRYCPFEIIDIDANPVWCLAATES